MAVSEVRFIMWGRNRDSHKKRHKMYIIIFYSLLSYPYFIVHLHLHIAVSKTSYWS